MNWTLQLFFFLESINAFDIKKEEKKTHKVKQYLAAKKEKNVHDECRFSYC